MSRETALETAKKRRVWFSRGCLECTCAWVIARRGADEREPDMTVHVIATA